MEFGSDHKVKIETLTREEAQHFIAFLMEERQRHLDEIDYCNLLITNNKDGPQCFHEFYLSALIRHQEDIRDIDALVEKVKEKFGL